MTDMAAAEVRAHAPPEALLQLLTRMGAHQAMMPALSLDDTSAEEPFIRRRSSAPRGHPLETGWTVWWDQGPMGQADYCDHLRNLGCFRTVEEFWSMYTSLARPFHLPAMSHYRGWLSPEPAPAAS